MSSTDNIEFSGGIVSLNNIDKKMEKSKEEDELETKWLSSKLRILKNLIVIGFAWIFLFTAFQSISNLQSSLNNDQGLGTVSLSTIYVTIVISCLFLPPLIISNIGLKYTIILSQFTYLLYIASNMYPRWYTVMPAAIILGLGAAPLWTSKCTYLTETALYYSKITKEKKEVCVNRFFGIFFAMFQTTQIWGNVISSTILKPQIIINSNQTNLTQSIQFCGAHDCPGSLNTPEIKKPLISTVYTLCGVYLGLAVLAIITLWLGLDPFYRKKETKKSESKNLRAQSKLIISTVKHLKKPNQLLLIPITLWLGFEQAFIGADFTRSFVTCTKGINYVGYTMICYGVTDVIGSYLFGLLAKFLGRIVCIFIGAILNFSMIFLMLYWQPNNDQTYVLFIIPICWGLADAAWQTQINSVYGILFPDTHEEAFSNFRLWESIGFAVAYAYSNFICTSFKLYLLLGYLTFGVVCFLIIELIQLVERKRKIIIYKL